MDAQKPFPYQKVSQYNPPPVAEVDDDEEEGEEPAAVKLPPRRILIVDDDPHILKSLKMYLEMEDFMVTAASGGTEALNSLRNPRPDLVVLDVMMPRVDGFQVLEMIRGNPETRSIPVVMLTAKGQDADVLRGHGGGVAAYMTKPVNYEELVDNIRLIFKNEDMARPGGNS